jgi:hypothetical protein
MGLLYAWQIFIASGPEAAQLFVFFLVLEFVLIDAFKRDRLLLSALESNFD